jgi:hypothetical protein
MVRFDIDGTGNNGVNIVEIDLPNVKRMRVNFETSGGITFVNLCADTIRVGFDNTISGGAFIPLAGNSVEFGATMADTTNDASSKSMKSSKARKLKDDPKAVDSTKEAKGRKLSSTNHAHTKKHKTTRRYTRGAHDKKTITNQ